MRRYHTLLFFLLPPLSCSLLHAQDVLNLSTQERLSGKLLAISDSGSLTFQPSNAGAPVTLEENADYSVEFPAQPELESSGSEQITFTNGDQISGELTALGAQTLTFKTEFAGDFSVRRDSVEKIQFLSKIAPQKELVTIDWEQPTKSNSWTINKNSFSALGKSQISHKQPLELPLNFIIRCSAQWTGNQPNFVIYLCADANQMNKATDGYSLQCSDHGLTLYRSSKTSPNTTVGKIPILLRHKEGSSIDLEFKIDRKTQQIAVAVDGKEPFIFSDPELSPPAGKHMIIGSSMAGSDSLKISNFKVLEWNGDLLASNSPPPDKLDETVDTLIDREGQTFKGALEKMESNEETKLLHFDSSLAKNTLEVPTHKTKTIHLKKPPESVEIPAQAYLISLGEHTQLSISSLTITHDQAQVTHPILGSFNIKTSSLKKLSHNSNVTTANHE